MSNIEPSVVEDQHKWTVFKSSVNLPAVLNDPRLVKRETDFFTKTWGVDFYERSSISPSHTLPEINRVHFEQYIRRTAAVSIYADLLIGVGAVFQIRRGNRDNLGIISYISP